MAADKKLPCLRSTTNDASHFLRLVSNRDRLALLCELSEGELGVSELETRTAIRQPSLSQQLGILRRDGVIAPRKEGKQVFYRIEDQRVMPVLELLDELYR